MSAGRATVAQTVDETASLVMTVLDEAVSLPGFLRTLTEQTCLPSDVVVVDGGSTDGTLELLQGWQPPAGVRLRVVSAPGAGISEGRNLAVRAARHDAVLITDAGTSLDPGWAESLLRTHRATGTSVAGFFRPEDGTPFQTLLGAAITPLREEIDPETFLPSSRSLLLDRKAWHDAGGYPEWLDYCEDLVLDLAVIRAGHRFTFAPDAVVSWQARPDVRSFVTQYYRYARGDGKAGLWPRRHALRYLAYGTGLVGAASGQAWLLPLLALGWGGYQLRFLRRVLRRRTPGQAVVRSLVGAALLVTCGDLAKMAGYPAGLLWRHRSDATPSLAVLAGTTDDRDRRA